VIGGANATLCAARLLVKTGRPYLYVNSMQSNYHDGLLLNLPAAPPAYSPSNED
jgi:hypothetical protein